MDTEEPAEAGKRGRTAGEARNTWAACGGRAMAAPDGGAFSWGTARGGHVPSAQF